METITLKSIDPLTAHAAMQKAGVHGAGDAAFMAANCACFEIDNGGGAGVGVLENKGETLWVWGFGADASKGLTADAIAVTESMAKKANCKKVGFKTSRAGLVRIAQKHGYRITAFILEKNIE